MIQSRESIGSITSSNSKCEAASLTLSESGHGVGGGAE